MRAGWVVSFIGHVGFVLMTMLAWEARSTLTPEVGAVVPVEIVDVAAESNVRALAEDVPEQEVAPEEQETAEAEPEPAPEPAPAPPQQRRQQNDEFDLAAIAGLIDRQRDPGRRRQEGERADRSQQGAGLGTAEVAALEDRARALARAHLRRCWRMPIDLPEPDRLVVTVEFDINRNGTLNGQPRVVSPRNYTFDPAMRTAVEAALRAVRVCDPYPFPDDPVVGEHYEIWRETEFTFRPSF
jgi:outer membrane biosynthesis protein TonB